MGQREYINQRQEDCVGELSVFCLNEVEAEQPASIWNVPAHGFLNIRFVLFVKPSMSEWFINSSYGYDDSDRVVSSEFIGCYDIVVRYPKKKELPGRLNGSFSLDLQKFFGDFSKVDTLPQNQ
ncbi:hypothetical protein V6N12_048435 [Hibiscus sabdariffa]|uniref:Uncharacterized protein n=1 Tax=Hibiscus sabdariffa TaxID=183260 RepID=A0ABR2EIR4_9ROSI